MADLNNLSDKIKEFESILDKTIAEATTNLYKSGLTRKGVANLKKLKEDMGVNFKSFQEIIQYINKNLLDNDKMMKKANAELANVLSKFKEHGRVSKKELTDIYGFYKSEVFSNELLQKINSVNQELKLKKQNLYNSTKQINSELTKTDMNLLFPFEAFGKKSNEIVKILSKTKRLNEFKSQISDMAKDSEGFLKYFSSMQNYLFKQLGSYAMIKPRMDAKISIGDFFSEIFKSINNPAELTKLLHYKTGRFQFSKNVSEFLLNMLSNANLKTPGSTQAFAEKFIKSTLKLLGFDTASIKEISRTLSKSLDLPNLTAESLSPQKSLSMSDLILFTAAFDLLRSAFPLFTRIVEGFWVSLKGTYELIDKFSNKALSKWNEKLEQSISKYPALEKTLMAFSATAVGIGLALGIIMSSVKYFLKGIDRFQKGYITAAQESNLNLLPFRAGAGTAISPTISQRFAMGGGEEKLIQANASFLSRMGGNRVLGAQTPNEQRSLAFIANFTGLGMQAIASLKDVMINVQGLDKNIFNKTMLNEFNKSGILFNRVIKDMTENLDTFILYGKTSFESLSLLSNKLHISIRGASGLIEKFSSVSSAIQTSYKLSLVTGKFINPLEQFTQYAYGSPDQILKNVLNMFGGSFQNMNRLQQKYLSEATGLSIQELATASSRLQKVQEIGESAYKQQYKTLDDIMNSFGFQRLLGGVSQILDILEKKVMNQYFQSALDWINKNGAEIPQMLENFASTIKNVIIPVLIKGVIELADGLIFVANHLGTIIGAYLGAAIGSLFPGAGTAIGLVAGALGGSLFNRKVVSDTLYNKMNSLVGDNLTSVHDAFITNTGRIVKTDPHDMAIFAKSNEGLLQNTLATINANGGMSNTMISQAGSYGKEVKVINIKSDVKLNGIKVGQQLSEIALEIG